MSAKPSPLTSANNGCGVNWGGLPQFTGAARLSPWDSRTLPAPGEERVYTSAAPSPLKSATVKALNHHPDPPFPSKISSASADPAMTGSANPLPFENRTTMDGEPPASAP